MNTACSTAKLSYYQGSEPQANLEAFFNGPIKAWGLIQDRKGRVIRRFDVDMVGSWQGNQGILEEDFRFYDGEVQKRVWNIERIKENQYLGTAADIIGTASGQSVGNAIRWKYQMDIPVGGRRFRITFDDWMWQMNDGILINRSYMKKFGFTVAELTLFMQKQ